MEGERRKENEKTKSECSKKSTSRKDTPDTVELEVIRGLCVFMP
jgi:hypothetical protein